MTTTRSRRTTRDFSCSETIILIYWNGCRGRSPTEKKKGFGSSSLTEEEEEEVAVAQRSERNRVVIKQENDNDNHITHSLQWNLQTSDSSWVEIEDRESQQAIYPGRYEWRRRAWHRSSISSVDRNKIDCEHSFLSFLHSLVDRRRDRVLLFWSKTNASVSHSPPTSIWHIGG